MKNAIVSMASLASAASLIACAAFAAEVTNVGPRDCRQGLVSKDGSDFSLFLFCDDAQGTQLGVIYTKSGVGPVVRGTEWSNTNRFWQEGAWMSDVNQLVWSTSGDYLYVVTGIAYSDNSLYELDLRQRSARKLYTGESKDAPLQAKLTTSGDLSVNGETFKMK